MRNGDTSTRASQANSLDLSLDLSSCREGTAGANAGLSAVHGLRQRGRRQPHKGDCTPVLKGFTADNSNESHCRDKVDKRRHHRSPQSLELVR